MTSTTEREFHVYDGRDCIGRFTLDGQTPIAKAFDADGKSLGEHPGFKAGAAAVSTAHGKAASAAAARRRLAEPVEFASGLPTDFRRARR
jgi:hypothetical protein